jgi:hypothetical protein
MVEVTIKVDRGEIAAKFGRRIPEAVRSNLRRMLPVVTRQVQERVWENELGLFKSAEHLMPATKARMVENVQGIVGQVYVDPALFPPAAAASLESGSRPHEIAARSAGSLYFFWPRVGKYVFFQSVQHPGFEGRSYMQSALDVMAPQITETLRQAMIEDIQKA